MRGARRVITLVAALSLFLVACTQSADPTTTDAATTTLPVPATTTTTDDPLLRLALPVDPAVVKGRLDNGLTYYIRENDSPGGRAELRLLVDAGSALEDPDQAGMAHFLEHMMFNGTERFPRNELVAVLESFGPRFGPDINAYTSYDETVYELGLTTEDPALIQLGVDVLREWAGRATLTETDVVEERGVILDEWRLRAQGYSARVNELLDGLILSGSRYDDHEPIGTAESIETTSPEALARFYRDWYRPERMAVVVVGDIDSAAMETSIVDAFGDLTASQPAREAASGGYQPPGEPRVASHTDAEATDAGVSVVWPVAAVPMTTIGDYQRSIAVSLGLGIVGDRLADDAAAGAGPLLGAAVVDGPWTRQVSVRGLDVEVRASSADEGLVAVLAEVERIRREGVGTEEVERALSGFAALSRQVFEEQESAQDLMFAGQIVDHHLEGADLMSPSQRFEIEFDILERLDKTSIDIALQTLFAGAPVILALGPDDPEFEIPGTERILEVWEGLATIDLQERATVDDDGGELMTAPAPAEILATSVDPRFGYTTLEYGNGATVHLWESDISTEGVHLQVEGFGGTSLVEVEDLPEAFLMTEIVGRSGVAELELPALRRRLVDRIVSVQPWVSETRQGLVGDSSSADVEVMLQLLHLTMVSPRFDEPALDAILDEMGTLNDSRADLPDVLFDEAVGQAYYGDDPRYFVLPGPDQLAGFDLDVARRLYAERLGDVSGFVFALVGDFDTSTMVDLASRYIGTLPGEDRQTSYIDHQPLPPRVVSVTTVEAGAGEQGQLGMFFTNELSPLPGDRLTADLLELILTARLRERIREELSATYSITVGVDLQRDPDAFAEASILSTGAPDGLEAIADEIVTELEDLQARGPDADEFDTAVEQLRDDLELIDNAVLASALVTAHLYPDEPVVELVERYARVDVITADDVRELAAAVFDLDQRIEVRQVPRP
ncbi:MAG TPA: insulinase family protein [Acidimicrobiia bacterium]